MRSLYTRQWVPAGELRASVLLVHGYAEHCGRYEAFAEALTATGIAVDAFDQRGHGNSPGRRGHIGNIDLLVSDLAEQVVTTAGAARGAPLFLFAHSMGGLVAVHYLASGAPAISGAIISSPLLAVPASVPAWKLRMAALLGALTPRLPVDRLDSTALSRNAAAVDAYDNDPLVLHDPIRARTGAELVSGIRRAAPILGRVRCPLLVIHGTADRLAPVAGGRRLWDGAGSPDKESFWETGGFHELLNDTNHAVARSVILDWLERHIPRSV